MIGVDVRIDHVRDAHAVRRGERDVRVDVRFVRVDDRTFPEPAATEEVRGASRLEVIERPEDHARAPSMRQPRARQSMTPCSMRCTLNPFLRRISTASRAMTQYGPRQYATTSRFFGSS